MAEMKSNPPSFTKYIDLAFERLGGEVLYASNEFFAPAENLIKPGRGVFIEDKYTINGQLPFQNTAAFCGMECTPSTIAFGSVGFQ